MSYATCRDAVKNTLLLLTGTFGANDISNGDDRILDSGLTNAAIMLPGTLALNQTGSYRTEHHWDVVFDLYTRHMDNTSYATFSALVDTVVAKLDAYPKLGTAGAGELLVIDGPVSAGEAQDVFDKLGAGPFFIVQRFRVRVREYVTQTTGEYA
jgi:hypothetical protein